MRIKLVEPLSFAHQAVSFPGSAYEFDTRAPGSVLTLDNETAQAMIQRGAAEPFVLRPVAGESVEGS